MTGDIRPIVIDAVNRSYDPSVKLFSTDAFGQAVERAFDLKDTPGDIWCRDVLEQLPYVTPVSYAQELPMLWRLND